MAEPVEFTRGSYSAQARVVTTSANGSRFGFAAIWGLLAVLCVTSIAKAQTFSVGVIDFYGTHGLSVNELRELFPIKEGDVIDMSGDFPPASVIEAKKKLESVKRVMRVTINPVCCEKGLLTIYVGISEQGGKAFRFRKAPRGRVRLPKEVVEAGREFEEALLEGMRSGDGGEDRTEGHSLMHFARARAVQGRFVQYAATYEPRLRLVSRVGADEGDRALAVQVLAYAANKKSVVNDLIWAISDPASEVRNNAIRALMVMAEARSQAVRIPVGPLVHLLKSPEWTDRNKSLLALEVVTRSRSRGALDLLRREALAELEEMAGWRVVGHSYPALMILARLSGISDTSANEMISNGQREEIVNSIRMKRTSSKAGVRK